MTFAEWAASHLDKPILRARINISGAQTTTHLLLFAFSEKQAFKGEITIVTTGPHEQTIIGTQNLSREYGVHLLNILANNWKRTRWSKRRHMVEIERWGYCKSSKDLSETALGYLLQAIRCLLPACRCSESAYKFLVGYERSTAAAYTVKWGMLKSVS
jgi:hypothetical protein